MFFAIRLQLNQWLFAADTSLERTCKRFEIVRNVFGADKCHVLAHDATDIATWAAEALIFIQAWPTKVVSLVNAF